MTCCLDQLYYVLCVHVCVCYREGGGRERHTERYEIGVSYTIMCENYQMKIVTPSDREASS